MSSCLIFQRPDICSTTSLESSRTWTSAAGSIAEAASQAGDQPAVLRDVVRLLAEGLGPLGEHGAGVGVADHGAVAGDPGVAARPAVGLDDEPAAHSPDSAVRTRMRRHSSQRSTSSSGADRMRWISTGFSSSWQPPQRRWCSAAAPMPPLATRIFS